MHKNKSQFVISKTYMSFSSVVLLSLLTKGSEYDYLDRKVIIQNQFSILFWMYR